MIKTEKNPITWLQINNILPIVFSLITVALSFAALNTHIMLIDQKVDILLAQQKEILAKYRDVEIRYGEVSLKVQALETIHER